MTVTVHVPVLAVLLAVNVTVLETVAGSGLKDALTPLGSPEAVKFTLPLNPNVGFTVMVLVPVFPWVTVSVLGDAVSVKFGMLAVSVNFNGLSPAVVAVIVYFPAVLGTV